MDFRDAARYFDHDEVRDGYTNALLFLGHTSAHDDHTSSGATSRRRTLTTTPNTVMPARGVVKALGDIWLVGSTNPDTFDGFDVRRNYDLKKTTGTLALLTPAQACLSAAGTAFHAHMEYFRDLNNVASDAEFDVMWNIFCPLAEPVAKGTFLRSGTTLLRVRNEYATAELLRIAETDQFDADALQAVRFTESGVIDLSTDLPVVVDVLTAGVQTDVPKYYEFRTEAEAGTKAGDRAVFIAKSAYTPKVGARFTMLGKPWRVVSVVDEADAWVMQSRLA